MSAKDYTVHKIERKDCEPFILGVHYAHRWPSISFAYGLFRQDVLVGCITYGSPPTAPTRSGLAGKENAKFVLELNRLCLRDNLKNEASFLVSRSLKQLPPKRIILSFADTNQDHVGIVYQAANFQYHGLSAKRTDWAIHGEEEKHNQTLVDEFKGFPNRAEKMREKYGDKFYLKPRPRKHRYVYLVGPRAWKREIRKAIRYPQLPYPRKITEQDCF